MTLTLKSPGAPADPYGGFDLLDAITEAERAAVRLAAAEAAARYDAKHATPHPYKVGDKVVRISGDCVTASKGQIGTVLSCEVTNTGVAFVRVWIEGTPKPLTEFDAPVWHCIYVRPAPPATLPAIGSYVVRTYGVLGSLNAKAGMVGKVIGHYPEGWSGSGEASVMVDIVGGDQGIIWHLSKCEPCPAPAPATPAKPTGAQVCALCKEDLYWQYETDEHPKSVIKDKFSCPGNSTDHDGGYHVPMPKASVSPATWTPQVFGATYTPNSTLAQWVHAYALVGKSRLSHLGHTWKIEVDRLMTHDMYVLRAWSHDGHLMHAMEITGLVLASTPKAKIGGLVCGHWPKP